jgi:hypothetical protein
MCTTVLLFVITLLCTTTPELLTPNYNFISWSISRLIFWRKLWNICFSPEGAIAIQNEVYCIISQTLGTLKSLDCCFRIYNVEIFSFPIFLDLFPLVLFLQQLHGMYTTLEMLYVVSIDITWATNANSDHRSWTHSQLTKQSRHIKANLICLNTFPALNLLHIFNNGKH